MEVAHLECPENDGDEQIGLLGISIKMDPEEPKRYNHKRDVKMKERFVKGMPESRE